VLDAAGAQVFAYDNPHHLGPIINATKGVPLRVKFMNLLPKGAQLFLPVDSTVTGAGVGPDGLTSYSQNRAALHLVGGETPWISAGTPHQWIAPAGETNPGPTGAVVDARGASTQNVPDMADPGPGANTLYFPNDISARFTFYHDRTSGLTRLNTYAGMEAGYFVTDDAEKQLLTSKLIPASADTIPLIIEDKTFVPADVAQQDARWNKDSTGAPALVWGSEADLWFPHVYETNQDLTNPLGVNPVGRFDFGPMFWPIFPAKDPLPSGAVGDATIVPGAYLDTPLVNGTAYPTVTVDPKAYRFRILNASVDRYLNLGLYKAAPDFKDPGKTIPTAPKLDPNGNPILDATGAPTFFSGTEVSLVRAAAIDTLGNPPLPTSAEMPYDPSCLCQYPMLPQNVNAAASGPVRAWPVDDRRGGVPDPTTVGPDIIAIGNDGGFLPSPVDIASQPITYEANRRSITVNNAYSYGLLLGPAERSDAIIDFSKYAGQTLIVYNDAPAPFPFSDERNDYYTGNPDLSALGGAYATKPGYGPNTRTIMQIKVRAAAPAAPFDVLALLNAWPAVYKLSQPEPLVPAVAYNLPFGTNDPDVYARISTGAAAQPTLDFTRSTAGLTLTGLKLVVAGGSVNAAGRVTFNTGTGTGYDPKNPPQVVFSNTVNGVNCLAPGGVSATATATVDPVTRQVNGITNFNGGSGYTCIPNVTFVSTEPVTTLQLVNGGTSYSNPQVTIVGGGGIGATAAATVLNGQITGLTLVSPGSGYTSAPQVQITDVGGSGTGALAVAGLAPMLGVGAQATVLSTNGHTSLPVVTVAEQELFDNRGRYNFTGGVEMPFTTAVNQTTVPLNYIDSATESMAEGEVKVWKVTVNGLFSNNLSFNLADVQLVNRVGWDGTLKPPSSNELGWKNSVRLNPLEDVVIAVRARTAKIPFGLPKSERPRDPSKQIGVAGSGLGFSAGAGLPAGTSRVNTIANYDNEFFWGSTLLSNSENDFLRPIVFHPAVAIPDAPTNLADPMGNGILTWTDATPGNVRDPKNEIGFKIMQAAIDAGGNLGAFTPVQSAPGVMQTVPANVTHWTMPVPLDPAVTYAVVAYNAAGEAMSQPFSVAPPVAPTTVGFSFAAPWDNAVTLNWSGGTASNKLEIWRTPIVAGLPGVPVLATTLPGSAVSFRDANLAPLATYSYQIKAINALMPAGVTSTPLIVDTPMIPVAAPSLLTATTNVAGTLATLRWTDNANNETLYWIDTTVNGVTTRTTLTRTAAQRAAIGPVSTTITTVPGSLYNFSVTAVNVTGTANSTSAAATTVLDLSVPVPAAPVLTRGVQTATRAPISWAAVTVAGASVRYEVQVSTNGGAFVAMAPTANLTANIPILAGNTYQIQVLARAARFGLTVVGPTSAPLDVLTPPALSSTPVASVVATGVRQVALTWTNASTASITSFTVDRLVAGMWVPQPAVIASSAVTATPGTFAWTDTVPAAGTYRYRVQAVGTGGSSAYTAQSNQVRVP